MRIRVKIHLLMNEQLSWWNSVSLWKLRNMIELVSMNIFLNSLHPLQGNKATKTQGDTECEII